MRILLLGYGKNGPTDWPTRSEARSHELVGKSLLTNVSDLDQINPELVDVAIEFKPA